MNAQALRIAAWDDATTSVPGYIEDTLDSSTTAVVSRQRETRILERQLRISDQINVSARPADTSVDKRKPPLTMAVPAVRESAPPLELLAEWNGYVTDIQAEGHFFYASLKGVKGEGVKDEEEDAVIPISDVSNTDRELLRPGNYFRLCVMYEVLPSGQPRRYTQVVFRRLPAYRQPDLDQAMARGRELARGLRVE